MKYLYYKISDETGGNDIEGVCHRSKVETLLTPGVAIVGQMISDEQHAKLVDGWGGVEVAPVVKAKPKKVA